MKTLAVILLSVSSLCAQNMERKDVSLTIYNQNLALVKDLRSAKIEKGVSRLDFADIASGIIAPSVKVKSLKNPLNILEQNFEYDLINSDKMLYKFIDNPLKIITKDNNTYSGNLLSFDSNYILLKSDDGKVNMLLRENIKNMEFSKMPADFRTKPTLTWLVNSPKAQQDDIEVSYLTNGFSWTADYVAVISDNDKALDLNSWVSVTNNSGTAYENASLKLMAGDLNIVKPESNLNVLMAVRGGMNKAMEMDEAAPQFQEKSFFEYHIYNLGRKTDLKNNQTKQISLFNAQNVKAEKIYTYDGAAYKWYFYDNWRNQAGNKKVDVSVKFKNSKENNIGMPFPKGRVRIYKKDGDSLEFVGEDNIDHTPKDEELDINMGQAFDITGERKIMNHQVVATNLYRDTYQIKIKNHKTEKVKVIVKERQWGDWKIIESSHAYEKKDKNNLEFAVETDKDGTSVLTYTAEYKF